MSDTDRLAAALHGHRSAVRREWQHSHRDDREYGDIIHMCDEGCAAAIIAADHALICPDPEAHSYVHSPFEVWQGACGHLWRKVDDGEECPHCADHALADAALAYDEVNRDMDAGGRHAEWWKKRKTLVHACDEARRHRAALGDKP